MGLSGELLDPDVAEPDFLALRLQRDVPIGYLQRRPGRHQLLRAVFLRV